MKIVKAYTIRKNGDRHEFISEDEYNRLTKEFTEKCDSKFAVEKSEDYETTGYAFYNEHNVYYLGWAFYPDFNK